MNYSKLSSLNKTGVRSVTYFIEKPLRSTVNGPPFSDTRARRNTPKIIGGRKAGKFFPGRNALKNISGRKAGEDHARSQCSLRGEDFQSQSADAGQSPSVASRTSCGQFRLRRAEERILGSGY